MQATLGLSTKDLSRRPEQVTLEDLSSRQLAGALSGVQPYILPSDLSALGGEYDAGLHNVSYTQAFSCFSMILTDIQTVSFFCLMFLHSFMLRTRIIRGMINARLLH